MEHKHRWVGGIVLVAAAVAFGCADTRTPVQPDGNRPRYETATATGEEVAVLERTTPLSKDITVRTVIGPEGGSFKIDGAGLYIAFGAGAVSEPTEIVVTAHAGKAVAYTFGPSLVFSAKVKIEQDLKNTAAYKNSELAKKLKGAYFPGDAVAEYNEDGTVLVTEIVPTEFEVKSSKIRFYVDHFSGYLIAIG